jgi:ANTAR domain
MLAERRRIEVDTAFVRMRAHARDNNLRLSDVAADLIDGRLDAEALGAVPTAPPRRQFADFPDPSRKHPLRS